MSKPIKRRRGFSPESSALDAYLEKVFCNIAYLVAAGVLSIALFYMIEYCAGNVNGYSLTGVAVLVLMDVFFAAASLHVGYAWKNTRKNNFETLLRNAKILHFAIIVVQCNYICYVLPSPYFWGYAGFAVVTSIFFFDYRLVDALSAALLISMGVALCISPELLVQGGFPVLNAGLMFMTLILSFVSSHLLAYWGDRILVKALEEAVETDPLTGLLNRRRMVVYQQDFYDNALHNNAPLTMAVMDIDDFKDVNDKYTHQFGDKVLKTISGVISGFAQEDEPVFRWGGEEILVLSACGLKEMVKRCEKLRKTVAETEIHPTDGTSPVRVTVTVGVAAYEPGMTLGDIFVKADKNLYKGKREGKNRVVYDQ